MTQIDLCHVNRDNTNLRKYSDPLWRELRKERYKKAKPDKYVNQMAAEEHSLQHTPNSNFENDVARFISTKLSTRESQIFSLFVFGGRMGQTEIAQLLGVSQSTVSNDLKVALALFKQWYFTGGGKNE